MSKAKKCDRCGAFYEPYKTDTIILTKNILSTDGLDLCPDCVNTFKLWLNNEVQMVLFSGSENTSECQEDESEAADDIESRRRKEAIKVIHKMLAYTDLSERANLTADMIDACHVAIKVLEQEPRKGHWIRVDKDKLRCSKCDVIHFIAQYPQGKIVWCPNCGAKMESEKKDEK